MPESNQGVDQARKELCHVANQHAMLDAAGVIGFFASVTRIVDLTGHYSDDFPKAIYKIGRLLSFCQRIRHSKPVVPIFMVMALILTVARSICWR